MFNKLSFAILFLALTNSVFSQVISIGRCPDVKYLDSFDLASYTGTWYEQEKFPFIFEFNQKCVTAKYSALENGDVGVTNSAVDKLTNLPVSIGGFAKVLGPGRLGVVFGATNARNPKQNYAVLGTDYTSWAFVYSCDHVLGLRTEYAWILSRERNATPEVIAQAKNVMKANGISEKSLSVTDQNGCNNAKTN